MVAGRYPAASSRTTKRSKRPRAARRRRKPGSRWRSTDCSRRGCVRDFRSSSSSTGRTSPQERCASHRTKRPRQPSSPKTSFRRSRTWLGRRRRTGSTLGARTSRRGPKSRACDLARLASVFDPIAVASHSFVEVRGRFFGGLRRLPFACGPTPDLVLVLSFEVGGCVGQSALAAVEDRGEDPVQEVDNESPNLSRAEILVTWRRPSCVGKLAGLRWKRLAPRENHRGEPEHRERRG